jgi:general secretion pathway protein N
MRVSSWRNRERGRVRRAGGAQFLVQLSTMRFLRILLAAIAILAVIAGAAAWSCPADLAYRFAADSLAPLKLHDLAGTIWQGHAGRVDVLGINLGAIDWILQPQPLLHGETIALVSLTGNDVSGRGVVERSDGQTWFRDATLRMPARIAAPVLAIPALELLGTIQIDIAHAHLRGLLLDDAAGTATWRDASVGGAAQAKLGALQATFAAAADGGIAGVVRDRGGPLEVAGTFRASLGAYEAQARLAARGDNPQVTEALQFIGQPQADGSRNLEIRGRQLDLIAP